MHKPFTRRPGLKLRASPRNATAQEPSRSDPGHEPRPSKPTTRETLTEFHRRRLIGRTPEHGRDSRRTAGSSSIRENRFLKRWPRTQDDHRPESGSLKRLSMGATATAPREAHRREQRFLHLERTSTIATVGRASGSSSARETPLRRERPHLTRPPPPPVKRVVCSSA
jgi:hypothetical protein